MLRISLALALAALTLASLPRCTDPTVIGGDLLDGNQLPITYTDTLPIRLTTVRSDVSQVVDFDVNAGPFGVGCLNDPLLGNTQARVGFELIERDSSLQLLGAEIDSIVLVLPLDPEFQVGDTTAEVTLRVVGAEVGSVDVDEALTDTPLASTGVEYGRTSVVPARRRGLESLFLTDTFRVDTVNPQIRIRLNDQFLEDIRPALVEGARLDGEDEANTVKDSVFAELFGGLIIEGVGCSATMSAVSVASANAGRFGVKLYYRRGDALRQYTLSFFRTNPIPATVPFRPTYTHDYSGTVAERLLAGELDTLTAVQSLDGLATRVEFPFISRLNNVAVNLAVLEIPVVRDGFTEPIARLIPRRFNSVGDYVSITNNSADGDGTFGPREGGTLERRLASSGVVGDSVDVYRFNITSYFQRIVRGERDPSFDLLPVAQVQIPGRSVLATPTTDGPQARLVLATTKLP